MAVENTQSPVIREGNLAWFSVDSNKIQRSSMGIFDVNIFKRKYQEYTFGLKIFDQKEIQNKTKRLGFTHVETDVIIKNSSIHQVFVKVQKIVFFIINSLKNFFSYIKGVFIKRTDNNAICSKKVARKPDETIKEKPITKGSIFWFSKNFQTRERYRLGLFKRVDILKLKYKEYFLGINIFNKSKTVTEEVRPFFWHTHRQIEVENGLIHRTFIMIGSIFTYTIRMLNVSLEYIKAIFINKSDAKI